MISAGDLYVVLTAMVPLYVAMMLGFASVRWWGIFSAVQCSGINRFVAVFAVPLLSFHFISSNDPYAMDLKFILADSASKVAVFVVLALWARLSSRGSLDWLITLFSLSTLPNTLVMGIPLLGAMYGDYYKGVMVQLVVLQSIIWYTLLLFLFEFRAARLLLLEQFPETAASIISFKVDPDVVSLDGREPLQTQAEVGEDGKIKVFIRRSVSTSHQYELFASPRRSMNLDLFASPRRSNMNTLDLFAMGLTSMPSSKAITPRPSNLTGAEIYSLTTGGAHSSQTTPRDITMGFSSSFDQPSAMWSGRPGLSPRQSNFTSCEMYSLQSSRCPTPRASNFQAMDQTIYEGAHDSSDEAAPQPPDLQGINNATGQLSSINVTRNVIHSNNKAPPYSTSTLTLHKPDVPDHAGLKLEGQTPLAHAWSSSTTSTPAAASEAAAALNVNAAASAMAPPPSTTNAAHNIQSHLKETPSTVVPASLTHDNDPTKDSKAISIPPPINVGEDFSFGSRTHLVGSPTRKQEADHDNNNSSKFAAYNSNNTGNANRSKAPVFRHNRPRDMPSSTVMIKLILQMVGRKLLRNPNTYASLIGLTWSLIAFRFGVSMPKIIDESLKILWQAGLGMAMFSLGLFMALQPRLIACGPSLAVFAMAVRFLTGPAVMAASSIAVGMRSVHLHAAIVQAALPQGIVPFVFSREYDLHPDVLSTAVIFGMLVALPVTLLYYVLLGL